MKVVLVHDWLTGMRGGEKVLERLCQMFPDAPVYTLLWTPGTVSATIERHRIRTSFLQRLPGAGRGYRWLLPLFPRAIEGLTLEPADVVISTSHAVAKSVIPPPGAYHMTYLHTPMRYIWELEQDYFPPGRFPWPLSSYVRATCARLRRWDVATAHRAHTMLANSAHVADRIARYYGRSAAVVHPPVDVERFRPRERDSARDYYLLAGAMAPYKNGELAIQACAALGRRLVVVGTGPEQRTWAARAGRDVEFRGWVSDEELAALYAGARGLLFPAQEDFGIIPVEAMASGCPVVAFGRGGALETVGKGASTGALAEVERGGTARVPGGVLFGSATSAALVTAMRLLEAQPPTPGMLRALAEPFAVDRFDQRFKEIFERSHEEWRASPGAGRAPRKSRAD